MTAHRPARARNERRFEIGFFIRKVVNGWVVFYKQFPPEQRAAVLGLVKGQASTSEAPAPKGTEIVAKSSSERRRGGGASDGDVQPQSGTGIGTGDGGPIGGARVEIGFFAATITETTSDDKDKDD